MVLFPLQRLHPIWNRNNNNSLSISSFREAFPWHVWSGQAIMIWLTMHTVLLSIQYAIQVRFRIRQWLALMVPAYYGSIYTEADVNFMGILSFMALVGLWIGSSHSQLLRIRSSSSSWPCRCSDSYETIY
jgi:hypothetical protein